MFFTVLMEDKGARNTFQYHKTFEKGGQRMCLFSLSDRTREQPNIKGIVSRIQQKLEYFWLARNRMRENQGRSETSLFCFL